MYSNADDVKQSIDGAKSRAATMRAILSGENWIVQASPDQIETVRRNLGGTVTTLSD
ncbi:hypothetical protein KNO15_18975 [Leifsonia shinshuensis]|uniref:hypothetical protein n=1 Tax=Leifsonia shinshuensis TaxID=150026 RepID=UPI001F514B9C|nr:hypothetical protein [Leifsonia shinshuensis]MCI0158788.1 hypothetical protein [Leifsonia shinshuensis]